MCKKKSGLHNSEEDMAAWKNGTIKTDDFEMDYIVFGQQKGSKTLIIIPGLGDGLRTVKGTAAAFSMMYRQFGKEYRVYVFSQRNNMKSGHTTRDMAADVYQASCCMGISKAYVLGVSQGGMIAQHLASDYPQFAEKLVLTVTTDRLEEELRPVLGTWITMASDGDYGSLMIDTAEKMYTEKKLRFYRKIYPLLTSQGKPDSFDRFLIMAQACLDHDTSERLREIMCPVLILGGGQDLIVGSAAAKRLALQIGGAKLHVYEDLGHGAYEESKDFQKRVLEFLKTAP
jgi:pimeloyl-ACP methyl ester carboxylesterase